MAVSASAVARVIGVTTTFVDLRAAGSSFLPQRIAVVGQGSDAATYATDPVLVQNAKEVGDTFGYGSPLHLAARELFPQNGDGAGNQGIPVTLYPLDAAGGAAAAAGTITPAGTQNSTASYTVRISGISTAPVSIPATTTAAAAAALLVAAINANLNMPVIATDNAGVVELDAKWSGESGNDITVEVLGETDGITFAIVQPTAGTTNPDVDDALANINSVWETMVVNTLNSDDSTSLDKFQTWGDGRVLPLVNKTAVVFSGSVDTNANLITLGNGRKDDRINALIPVEASVNLPLQIAARAVSRIAVRANNNPARDYPGLVLTGIIPGDESTRWTYTQRDNAVKAGISTVEIVDGAPQLSDVVTFYHPDGEVPPAYRYVVDIVKLQNIQYEAGLIFASDEWQGAPLLNDDDVTVNVSAKKPKNAVAALSTMVRNLGLNAIIADVDTTVSSITAEIDGANPKRLNCSLTVKLSGNGNIFDVGLNFGFNFGGV